MSDLVRYYREYYREQTTSSFDDLFRCATEYDFFSYHEDMRRVLSMWRESKCMGESNALLSGGSSTGSRRLYQFGPNFHHVRNIIESFLRQGHRKTVSVNSATGLPRVKFNPGKPPQNDFQLMGSWAADNFVGELLDFSKSLSEDFGPINLCATPHIWIQLTTNPLFYESATPDIFAAMVNTDNIKCFSRSKCRVIDQMMDWSGGVNFYTCEFGEYHFLPFFCPMADGSPSNLLNLKKNLTASGDLVTLGDRVNFCPCGSHMIKMNFVPHWRYFPVDSKSLFLDPSVIVGMAGERTNVLQVYQKSDGSFCLFHHACTASSCARDMIGWLDSFGFGKTELFESRYFAVGTKKPLFWRGGSPSFLERN